MGVQILAYNGPMQTTAAPSKVATGAAIKTMLQMKLGANVPGAKVIEWGCSFDASAAATPGVVELIETDVAATVTAYVANDLTKYNNEALAGSIDPTTALLSVGTAASGYTASAEGTITAVRNLAAPQLVAPTNQNIIQLPLGREPALQNGKFLRVRATFPATVNMFCYVILEF